MTRQRESRVVMRETRNLEYKRQITNTFLKTVSAYANYGKGEIRFGVDDDGVEIGVQNPVQVCMDIENKINDNIVPVPDYRLNIIGNTSVVVLTVEEGANKPYFYKSKAYKRNDSATIEVDRLELTRLILEGENTSFEEMKSEEQELKFTNLENKICKELNIEKISLDILKTLELYNGKKGYNNAAALLADENQFPGIDVIRFGKNINIILERETFVNESVLSQYDKILVMFRKNYQYEEIEGAVRIKKELIPEEAFREAIANALAHRTWDVKANINVAMYEDRIEIASPGGLPRGISEEEYRNGGISIPRNYILCNVFLRLHMIERFGTGIKRINEFYKNNALKPQYLITENMIKISLPIVNGNKLEGNELLIYNLLELKSMSSSEIIKETGWKKSKTISILNKLVSNGYIAKTGNGRGTKYQR